MDFVAKFKHWEEHVSQVQIGLSPFLPPALAQDTLISHIRKYSSITLRDIYKFIHQGTCGWSHLSQLGSLQHLQNMLIKEIASVGVPFESDELFELLDETTGLGRINLRIWKNDPRVTTEDLWTLMLESNTPIPDSSFLFLQRWKFVQECTANEILLVQSHHSEFSEKWLNLVSEMVKEKTANAIPLVSHSRLFRTAYSPQYRLAHKRILEAFLKRYDPT
ncbi:MAG: hypothetical protein KAR20_15125 [Candidatus Heimdallarchaeota archaeon]|nr:hypothetical protein [Candidatus Heimdallarchaeota archaeon]